MKLCKYLVAFTCLLASCSETDEITDNVYDGDIRNAVVRIEPFVFEGSETRTDLTYKDNKITFSWDDDETIGVFPISPYQGSQAYKHLERSGDDGHVATFDGGGWKIRPNATYSAYYPYNGKLANETTFDKIPVSLKRQVQDGYNNLAHIGDKYDYMCATATAPSEGDIVFNFKHITSIIQLEVTLPEPGVITNVIIFDKEHEPVFVDSALMNVQTREITPVHKNSMVELDVKNGTEVKANEKVLFYVTLLPKESRPVDITVEMQDGKCYETSYTPKDMKAGYAYKWSISPEFAGEHVGVDLGLPSGTKWATMNVGAKSVGDYGKYYAWGETEPRTITTNWNGGWESYKWYKGTAGTMTKYCTVIGAGIVDNKTILDAEDDAATQNWGGKWRMPTGSERDELVNNCYWEWTNNYANTNAIGYIVYKAKSPSDKGKIKPQYFMPLDGYSLSDTHIFMPAAGVFGESIQGVGYSGLYWASTTGEVAREAAEVFIFSADKETIQCGIYARNSYFSVRAVCK